jgi:hypothetical protein
VRVPVRVVGDPTGKVVHLVCVVTGVRERKEIWASATEVQHPSIHTHISLPYTYDSPYTCKLHLCRGFNHCCLVGFGRVRGAS